MTEPQERREFQAEVKQLLDLMIHSLYSNKDIFLRELLSNGSDALDKLRFQQLTNAELRSAAELAITIERDPQVRSLAIVDNGIGMTRAEVIEHLGTIAKSGTKEFLTAVRKADTKEMSPELIGQFGVGFYSAFMVADRVTVVTRRAGESTATRWESTGDGTYTVEETTRDSVGTTVTLHLKPVQSGEGDDAGTDYCDPFTLEAIVKRHSDFVAYPIRMKVDDAGEPKTLNSMKAIWERGKSDVTDAELKDFYRHIAHDWNEPLRSVPVKIEGTFEASALLFVPGKAPFDVYNPEMKRGLQLYVKRVFVMDECRDLMPAHLRFVKGVVDAHDLSLNVSREILQKDRQIQAIRKQLVKKVYATLDTMRSEAPEDYRRFWSELGPVLKEGLLSPEKEEQDRILPLVLAATTNGTEPTTLDAYVDRMKPAQEAIYFLSGPALDGLAKSPLLEAFREKGYEVLLFADPVDELWLERAPKFKDKALRSIGRGDVELGSEQERKDAATKLEDQKKEHADLFSALRVLLQDDVKDVRLSQRLTSSPVCLVRDERDPSPRVVRMLEQLGQKPQTVKPVLELNPGHPIVAKLEMVFRADQSDPRLKLYADLLLGQAHLADSGQLPDPSAFAKTVAEVMVL